MIEKNQSKILYNVLDMEFKVEMQSFQGPLDLILHLIAEKKMNILDLDITLLTDQYIAYLNAMEDTQLDLVGEYMSELATLMEIKSKTLLPKETIEFDDEYQEDPRERLVKRLLEYQQFKEISATMNDLYYQRSLCFGKPMSECVEEWIKENDNGDIDGNVYDLVKAMNRVLRRMLLNRQLPVKYTAKELSTQDRCLEIKARFVALPDLFNFEQLCSDCHQVQEVIVTFLAVLDMARRHELHFSVDKSNTIWLKKGALA